MFAFAKTFPPQFLRTMPRLPALKLDWKAILTVSAILAFAAFCGLAIPFVGIVVPAVLCAMALCVVLLVLSPVAIVWLMFILVLLVVGLLTFFLGIQQALWLPYLLLLLIAVKYLMEQLRFRKADDAPLRMGAISIAIGLSCLLFFLSALANKTDYASVGVAAKNYIFPWFLTLLVATSIQRTHDIRGIWKFFLWVVVIQLPFAIPQHFYFAKRAGADWDAVVGTFGGNYLRGGASGTMAIFVIFGIVLAASLFRHKQIGWKMLACVVITGLATVALAEVKMFFIGLPLGLILLFRKSILVNPIESLGFGLIGGVLLGAVVFIYQQGYSENLRQTRTLEGLIDYALSAESDPYYFNPTTKEVSRVGAVLMWVRYNDATDHRFFLGHGPAASRESQTLGTGVAARKYPFTLGTSTTSSMLWDVGLLGYGFMLGTLFVAGVGAFRLAHHVPATEAAALDSIGVMLWLSMLLSLYNRDQIDSAAMQVLLAFWIGYVLLCRTKFRAQSPSINDAKSCRVAP
jgi:hypothetical protein